MLFRSSSPASLLTLHLASDDPQCPIFRLIFIPSGLPYGKFLSRLMGYPDSIACNLSFFRFKTLESLPQIQCRVPPPELLDAPCFNSQLAFLFV
jgi:hypothetical protein